MVLPYSVHPLHQGAAAAAGHWPARASHLACKGLGHEHGPVTRNSPADRCSGQTRALQRGPAFLPDGRASGPSFLPCPALPARRPFVGGSEIIRSPVIPAITESYRHGR